MFKFTVDEVMSGVWMEKVFGIPLDKIFLTYNDDEECNLFYTCVSVLGPEVRVQYEMTYLPPMGILWSVAYFLYVLYGFRNKRTYMPFFPLLLNIRFFFTWRYVLGKACMVWFFLDVGLLITFFLYGEKQLPVQVRKGPVMMKIGYFVFCITMCFLFVFAVAVQFNDWVGNSIAFYQNAIMSLIFLLEALNLESFDSIDWIDFIGGVCRAVGSLPVSIYMVLIYDGSKDKIYGIGNILIFYIMFVITICDFSFVTLCFFVCVSKLLKKTSSDSNEDKTVTEMLITKEEDEEDEY